ncbi:MAG: hypothetical protein M5U12_14045 [Verrucomicrobia bacterium]|nr:hypothetical protein [Verrucomicrobiota bacterium]
MPAVPGGTEGYLELAARGWLDSDIRDGARYRHAAPGFPSQPAADAALYQDWLATRVGDTALAERLEAAARAALEQVPATRLNFAQVGHVRYPAPALVYGSVPAQLARAEENGRALLGRFAAEGLVRYQQSPNGLDYGRTHWASDANGLTAQVLGVVLDEAAFTGDPGLIEAGLRHLRALTERYRGGVPRGGADVGDRPAHAGHPGGCALGALLCARVRAERRCGLARGGAPLGVVRRSVRLSQRPDVRADRAVRNHAGVGRHTVGRAELDRAAGAVVRTGLCRGAVPARPP